MFPSRRSGVALVITVVMISIITFLAVAFLTLTGRERGSVRTATDSTMARNAADVANERAKAEIIGAILATTNIASIDLLVSTNFVNWNGFDPAAVVFNQLTNVNYDYLDSGTPGLPGAALNLGQSRRNLTNLFFNPRPPVYITNRLTGGFEFRYYIDLNRNGRFENTGLWPVTNLTGTFYGTDGTTNPVFTPTIAPFILSNYITGDPQWIGGLDRSDKTHSADNQFLYRYAYIVVPEGKTMDINYIHNSALATNRQRMDAFGRHYFRNQGVGTWEINMAAFLRDLNTNQWDGYAYDPVSGVPTTGVSFADALGFYRYQLNGPAVGNVFNMAYTPEAFGITYQGTPGIALFRRDQMDGYTDGPLQTAINYAPEPPPGTNPDDTRNPWPGAIRRHHFFTTQEFFDPTKANRSVGGLQFTDRLYAASGITNVSTYDQTTFYRMLAQLGTDSASADDDKLNLNYVNIGGLKVTNFVSWTDADIGPGNPARGIPQFGVPGSVLFFTNAVDRLLKLYSERWKDEDYNSYTNTFGNDFMLAMTNLPVRINNRFAYAPSVHRILQLAANIYDSTTNRLYDSVTNSALPTVFRPLFRVDNANSNIFISGFVEVTNNVSSVLNARLVDPMTAAVVLQDDILFGVPLVIGAKKGIPNFNEFSMQSVFDITRKLQVTRTDLTDAGRPNATNMMYVIGVSNAFGVELWNSYSQTNNRVMDVYVTNYMTASLTNSDRGTSQIWITNNISGRQITINPWPGYKETAAPNKQPGIIVPLGSNVTIIPLQAYDLAAKQFRSLNSLPGGFIGYPSTGNPRFPNPQWGMWVTNRLQVALVDRATQRIIDYVVLRGLDCVRDLSEDIRDPGPSERPPTATDVIPRMWLTNFVNGQPGGLPEGVFNQLRISSGYPPVSQTVWDNYGGIKGVSKDYAIAYFSKFNREPGSGDTGGIKLTNRTVQVPFSPTKRMARKYSWQANDPLVHFISDDLKVLDAAVNGKKVDFVEIPNDKGLVDENFGFLGAVNWRYEPWGNAFHRRGNGYPNDYNQAIKDPSVASADSWNFMTNKFAGIGWLGRVHRGTPWQTIYLKSTEVDIPTWTNWASSAVIVSSNLVSFDSVRTQPSSDRLLFDVFTTALNENSTRGQLPINVGSSTNPYPNLPNLNGLAAWSAAFSGMVALTPTNMSRPLFTPVVIQPAGVYDPINTNTWSPLVKIVNGINNTRANTNLFRNNSFQTLGDIMSVPEMTDRSPFLDPATFKNGINDAAYEWLPQQVMSLLQVGKPRFAIYAYGQALLPAPNSIVTAGGAFFGLCTNYAITSEVATRTVVEIEGGATAPRVVVKSYNILGPD